MLLFQQPAALLLLLACSAPEVDSLAWPVPQTVGSALTQQAPPELQLPRHPALSPDGRQVAFSHQGDIWVASVATGLAQRLTAHDAYDGRPKWSPDGQWLGFVSNRHGNWDVYIMPAVGGTPQRLTWHAEGEKLYGWIDNERLLIGAQRDRRYSRRDRGIWVAYRDGRTPTVLGDWAALSASLSADGQSLVYERGHGDPSRRAYRGAANSSLWIYSFASQQHQQLTQFDGNDLGPMLSADGKMVYFLSDRACKGNEDGRDLGLWQVPAAGGKARLVYHPGGRSLRNASLSATGLDVVCELDLGLVRISLADGKAHLLPVYGSVDPSDPVVHERVVKSGAEQMAIAPDGESIAFVAAGDVYVMRNHDKIHRCVRVSTNPAPDYDPVWLEDGKTLLFVSERDGNAEFYQAQVVAEAEAEAKPFYLARNFQIRRITQTSEDETQPQLSPDGKTLAWVVGLGKLVVGDPLTAEVSRVLNTGFEGPVFDWSPDSQWLVYSKPDNNFNYDVFLQRVNVEGLDPAQPGVAPYNLTSHPDDDTGPFWSPDGRRICFTSRRMMLDETDVWMVDLRAEDLERNEQERLEAEEQLAKAKEKKKEKPVPDASITGLWQGQVRGPDPVPAEGMVFQLQVLKIAERLLVKVQSDLLAGTGIEPQWDAETHTLRFQLQAEEAPTVVVELVVHEESMQGVARVGAVQYPLQAKRSTKDSGLQLDEEEEKVEDVEPVQIDWENLRHRVVRVTRREGNETALGWKSDSKTLYFNATTGTRLTQGTTAETGFYQLEVEEGKEKQIEAEPVGDLTFFEKTMVYGKGGKLIANDGKAKTLTFSVRFRENRKDLRRQVVEQVWRVLDRMFYDPNFHGHDWRASLEKWLPATDAATTPEDYGEMVNWMLGEMNASHMGYYNFGKSSARETDAPGTGFLGVLWDEDFPGPGRKVREVLPDSPAARSISALHVGDVVLAVNGQPYQVGDNWYRLMEGTAEHPTYLEVVDMEGGKREVVIRPAASLRKSLYRRFEEQTRKHVQTASGGRLGYIHIESMSTGPLVDFERNLFAAGEGKDALLIDVRENGGGWTTDMILAMLTVRDHAITIPRGGGEGYPQGRRVFATWNKPIVVLCNENSYSNAEIFSWAIKTLHRGPLVGKQTYGAVISTGGTTLMDGSFVRLPFRGWYVNDRNHTNMELHGCPPDYPVENLPGDWVLGLDRQLEKAIEVGLSQL